MATILRTEPNTLPQGQAFNKLILADSGMKFNFIKLNGENQVFTNEKEHIVAVPAGSEDAEIIVCQVEDVAPPPSKFRVRVEFNAADAQIKTAWDGIVYDGYGIFSGFAQYPPAGIEYTSGELFTGFIQIKPGSLNTSELFQINVNGVPRPSIVGTSTTLIEFVVSQDSVVQILTRSKGSIVNHTVRATSSGGGTVTPATRIVQAGQSAFLQITPDAGKIVKSFTVNQQANNTYNQNGGQHNLGAIYADTDAHIIFGDAVSSVPAANAIINWFIYDRLTGSDTEALLYDRSTFINTNITERTHKKNGVTIAGFSLPYAYTSDKLMLLTAWDVGYNTIDEFIDSLNANYLRLAIHSMGKDGNNLFITTRLNNSYARNRQGWRAADVSVCRLKVTDPNGAVLLYNHPVLSRITDLTHTVPLTVVGVYTFETETILSPSGLQTSYAKAFAELIVQ